tara:strand:- start:2932 stop:4062 length:1131 start_codon:yes stop_codon:yes gene_type:complete
MTTTKEAPFTNVVGQVKAKRRLNFYLDGYNSTRVLPHLMFIAPKGCGKTMMAKEVGKQLAGTEEIVEGRPKAKKFLEINCSTIKSVKQFINQIVVPHVNQQECTVLFDECSELPKDVTMALLTILNPNAENRTTFSYEDYVCDFDFRQQSFMFATTEAQTIFHALMDRCERIDLEEYTYGELGEIVQRVCKDVTFEDGLVNEIATVLRGNARAAQKMSTNIKNYLGARKATFFSGTDWASLQHSLGILPLGLSPIELQILYLLAEKRECSLTYLSAKTGLTKPCLQRDFEMYLQKSSLMEISTAGRKITAKGKEYLENLPPEDEDQEQTKEVAEAVEEEVEYEEVHEEVVSGHHTMTIPNNYEENPADVLAQLNNN